MSPVMNAATPEARMAARAHESSSKGRANAARSAAAIATMPSRIGRCAYPYAFNAARARRIGPSAVIAPVRRLRIPDEIEPPQAGAQAEAEQDRDDERAVHGKV